MNADVARAKFERAHPYVTVGTLVAVLSLIAMLIVPHFETADAQAADVQRQVDVNTTDIANLKQHDRQQDAALRAAANRTDAKLDELDKKISHVIDLIIQERQKHG